MLNIPGIDTKKGLAGLMGKEERYIKMLGVFCAEGRAKLSEIAAALELSDLRLYTIYVHGIKSTAASIGAAALAEEAKDLEAAARREDFPYINKHNPSFAANLEAVLANIDIALKSLSDAAPARAADAAIPVEILKTLRVAFDAFDSRTISKQTTALKEYAGLLPGFGEVVEEILAAKRLGEYEAAVAIIDNLLNEK